MNIMIVEDEAISAMLMKVIINQLGHSVVKICASGEDAVESAGIVKPDLIFMDILLSGQMDGIKAAEEIRSKYNIPLVFATGYDEDDVKERAMQTGACSYLIKPIQHEDIAGVIKSVSQIMDGN